MHSLQTAPKKPFPQGAIPRKPVASTQATKGTQPVPRGPTAAAAAPGDTPPPAAEVASEQAAPRPALPRTCRRCKQQFDRATNGPSSCRFHSDIWTGGELAKAVGFCRQSDAPEHQLRAVLGRTGLLQFWDCCGAEDEDAPGCCTGRHVTYDDPDD